MKAIKRINNFELELTYSSIDNGCRVSIKAVKPYSLFQYYKDDMIKLKEELENTCDNWVEESESTIYTHFTLPMWSFTSDDISLVREYTF